MLMWWLQVYIHVTVNQCLRFLSLIVYVISQENNLHNDYIKNKRDVVTLMKEPWKFPG